ncbi:MAG: hypothetical protein KY434_11210 [Actinobacteria bacterium]|nr:hypothetical protein [Actinomycetota bacterium]
MSDAPPIRLVAGTAGAVLALLVGGELATAVAWAAVWALVGTASAWEVGRLAAPPLLTAAGVVVGTALAGAWLDAPGLVAALVIAAAIGAAGGAATGALAGGWAPPGPLPWPWAAGAAVLIAVALVPLGAPVAPVTAPAVAGVDLGDPGAAALATLLVVAATLRAVRRFDRGAAGRGVRMLALDPHLAGATGVDTATVLPAAGAVVGAAGGLAGVLAVVVGGVATGPGAALVIAVVALAGPLLGGLRHPDGPVIGALALSAAEAIAVPLGAPDFLAAAGLLVVAVGLGGQGLLDVVIGKLAHGR